MTGDQNSSCCCNSDNTSEDRDGHEQTDQRRDSAPAMSGVTHDRIRIGTSTPTCVSSCMVAAFTTGRYLVASSSAARKKMAALS